MEWSVVLLEWNRTRMRRNSSQLNPIPKSGSRIKKENQPNSKEKQQNRKQARKWLMVRKAEHSGERKRKPIGKTLTVNKIFPLYCCSNRRIKENK